MRSAPRLPLIVVAIIATIMGGGCGAIYDGDGSDIADAKEYAVMVMMVMMIVMRMRMMMMMLMMMTMISITAVADADARDDDSQLGTDESGRSRGLVGCVVR